MKKQNKRMTHEEFVLLAIDTLAKDGAKSIHTVFSGFNEGFREYFPGDCPIKVVKKLVDEGKISFGFRRGGAAIARPGVLNTPKSDDVLKKMGLS